MKKLCPLILCTLFSLSAASIETVDYTQGLSVWFDTPNNLDGQAIWLRATAQGRIRTKHGKPFATYREWQPRSEYHGLHIRRTNHTE